MHLLGLSLLVVALAPGCRSKNLDWDSSADKRVIEYGVNTIGHTHADSVNGRILHAVVWGNGRMVYKDPAPPRRTFLESKLDASGVQALLQEFNRVGFFEFRKQYGEMSSVSPHVGSTWLSLQLRTKSHEVTVVDGPPDGFEELERLLQRGAGVRGKPYVPKRGILTAEPDSEPVPDTPMWDSEAFGLDLAKTGKPTPVTGKALQEAWRIVNELPGAPRVQQGGRTYVLLMQIPELRVWTSDGSRGAPSSGLDAARDVGCVET